MIGKASSPDWLATDGLLVQFAIRRSTAVRRYMKLIAQGIDRESIWKDLNRQIFLGDDQFVSRMQAKAKGLSKDVNIPRVQIRPPAPSLQAIAEGHKSRNNAIVAAYASGAYSYQQIAEFFGLHFTTIGKIVRAAKAANRNATKLNLTIIPASKPNAMKLDLTLLTSDRTLKPRSWMGALKRQSDVK